MSESTLPIGNDTPKRQFAVKLTATGELLGKYCQPYPYWAKLACVREFDCLEPDELTAEELPGSPKHRRFNESFNPDGGRVFHDRH